MNYKITVIIPVRREEETIIHTLKQIGKSVKTPYKILVVDDRKDDSDRTTDVVRTYAKGKPEIEILKKAPADSSGFGAALGRGIRAVKSGAVVFVMADLCDDVLQIDLMYKKLQNADVVVGSRYMEGGQKIGGPVLQGIFSTLVNKTLKVLTGIPASDISNAFKMYRIELLKKIFVDPTLGVEVSMDMLFQAYRAGAVITEIPTVWQGRTVGASKFRILERFPKYARMYIRAFRLVYFPSAV